MAWSCDKKRKRGIVHCSCCGLEGKDVRTCGQEKMHPCLKVTLGKVIGNGLTGCATHAAFTKQDVVSNRTAQSAGTQSLIDQCLCVTSKPTMKTSEWLSAEAVQMEQCEGTAWKFQGVLLDYNTTPYLFTVPKNDSLKRARSDARFAKAVRSVRCLDKTGPATIFLWGESDEAFEKALQTTVLSSANVQKWFLTVERIRVNDFVTNKTNGNILTPMRSINSIDASAAESTTIAITTTPTSPFLQNTVYTAPKPPYCIMYFQQVRRQFVVPFRATLRGTAVDVRKGHQTQKGDPKTSFSLVDPAGAYLNCCAIGERNACSDALAEGSNLVLYNVSGRRTEGQEPLVWLFQDATVVCVGTSSVEKRIKIELLAAKK